MSIFFSPAVIAAVIIIIAIVIIAAVLLNGNDALKCPIDGLSLTGLSAIPKKGFA